MSAMFANKEVATRHLPVARGPAARDAKTEKVENARDRQSESRRSSETRLQATVVRPRDRKRDDTDPYADVPCTD